MKKRIIALICAVSMSMSLVTPAMAGEITNVSSESKDANILYSGTVNDLNWSIDENGHFILSGSGDYGDNQPWQEYAEEIRSAKIDVKDITSLEGLFENFEYLETVDLSGLDTSKVTNMAHMFYRCCSLTNLDVSGFDTSNVTNMEAMFYDCLELTKLDLSSFNTSKVTNMKEMFKDGYSLLELNISSFDTSKVTDMSYMFEGCFYLTELDVSGFATSNVANMSYMFYNCDELTALDVSSFDTSKVTDMSYMFYYDDNIKKLDVSGFDTSNVTNMSYAFYNCNELTALDVSGFDTSKVNDMASMFTGCKEITELDVSNFDTRNVTDMSSMFEGCTGIKELNVGNFDTRNVTNMYKMFSDCSGIKALNVSDFDTKNVTDMSYMVAGCSGITELDVSRFNTSKVTNMGAMFWGCKSLTKLDVKSFDTSKVKEIYGIFEKCSNLKKLDLSSWDMKTVDDGEFMFEECGISELYTPRNVSQTIELPIREAGWIDNSGKKYSTLPKNLDKSIYLFVNKAHEHIYSKWTVEKKASINENGSKVSICSFEGCNERKTQIIPKIDDQYLSYTKVTYNGSAKKPKLTVKDAEGNSLVVGKDYDVTYASGRKAVGRYKVTVSFKGNYSGKTNLYFTIVPKAPASVSANLYGYDDVKVSWKKATGASGYTVYYKKASASSYKSYKRTTGTSVKISGLSDGVKYSFKVVPYYKSGTTRYASLTSKVASVYTLKKLSTPTVSTSGTSVRVKWNNISGETGYQISRSTSKTGTNIVSTYKTTSGTYKKVSATKGKTYYYKVRAYKVVGDKKVYAPWSTVKAYKR